MGYNQKRKGHTYINNLKTIFDQLQSTTSRKEKEYILLSNKDNHNFKTVLHFLLNPYITTGISAKKIAKKVSFDSSVRISDILGKTPVDSLINLFNYLKANNTGRDRDILMCQMFTINFNNEEQNFINALITKSLKIGIDSKTVNKIYGKGFIPTFECMLAEKYFEHLKKVDGKEFTITLKLDGIRALLVKENGKVLLFSRQGQLIEGLVDIEKAVSEVVIDNFVIDGELLIQDTSGISSKDQYKATTKIVRKDGEKHNITLRAFDMLDIKEFKNQKCETAYTERRETLHTFLSLLNYGKPINDQFIVELPVLYSGTDINMILKILDEVRADNQEGVMININDAPYEFKRTTNLLKVKVMQDCDLMITGFEEGSGRLSGTLGRLNVDYKGNVLGVGGGFSDAERTYFWKNQQALLGRVVKVQYFEETRDKNGVRSLRFPVFKELREEGKEVSYS